MRRLGLLGLLGLTLLAPTSAQGGVDWHGASFHSPTGNLRCVGTGGRVHCGSLASGTWLSLGFHGGARYSTPKFGYGYSHLLAYGRTWQWDDALSITCKSLFTGMSCSNLDGYRFVISRFHFSYWQYGNLIYSA